MKKEASQTTILSFCKAVYPESTELAMSFSSEHQILTDATKIIKDLRDKLANIKKVGEAYLAELDEKLKYLSSICNDKQYEELSDNRKDVLVKDKCTLIDKMHAVKELLKRLEGI